MQEAKQGVKLFALRFSGYIQNSEDGVYGVFSTSADGRNLYINDELFLPNDFKHPKLSFTKRIAQEKGLHKIQLDYFYNRAFEKFFMLEIGGSVCFGGLRRRGYFISLAFRFREIPRPVFGYLTNSL